MKKRIFNVIEVVVLLIAFASLFSGGAFSCENCHSFSYMELSMDTILPIGLIISAFILATVILCLVSIVKNNKSKDSFWHVSLPILTMAALWLGGMVMTGAHECTMNIDFVQAKQTFWIIMLWMFVACILSFIKRSVVPKLEKEAPQVINNIQETSNADELKKYKDLLDSGIITQEEFDEKKKQLLGL